MHFTKPTHQQYPSFYYYQQISGNEFQVPTVGYLSPSNYPFQRPPLPIVIFVTKIPDQSSGSNEHAVQVLTPTSAPVSNSSAAPTTVVKPVDTPSSVSNTTSQTSTPTSVTPQSTTPALTTVTPASTPPQQATTTSTTLPVNSTSPPTSPTKPSAPTTLPNYKPPETTTPTNQRSLDSISWKDRWQQNVYKSTGTHLCQTNDPRGTFPKKANDQCNSACEEAFDNKLDQIGLTETGVISLGGSCHRQVQTNRDVCLCNVRLGLPTLLSVEGI
ncbi:hypothetical protein WDU94_015137 [Cyamophila willieti]